MEAAVGCCDSSLGSGEADCTVEVVADTSWVGTAGVTRAAGTVRLRRVAALHSSSACRGCPLAFGQPVRAEVVAVAAACWVASVCCSQHRVVVAAVVVGTEAVDASEVVAAAVVSGVRAAAVACAGCCRTAGAADVRSRLCCRTPPCPYPYHALRPHLLPLVRCLSAHQSPAQTVAAQSCQRRTDRRPLPAMGHWVAEEREEVEGRDGRIVRAAEGSWVAGGRSCGSCWAEVEGSCTGSCPDPAETPASATRASAAA